MISRLCLACAAAAALFVGPAARAADLVIASWGGDYAEAQKSALIGPWMAARGKTAEIIAFDGAVAGLQRQAREKVVEWDVVDIERGDARMLCDRGLLQTIDPATLPPGPDGAPAAQDFVSGALETCAVSHGVWSTVLAFDSRRFLGGVAELDLEKTTPARLREVLSAELGRDLADLSIVEIYALASAHIRIAGSRLPQAAADFFDLERFPGKRGLRQTPEGTLELALIADGAPVAEVYGLLATEEGLARAFAMLDRLRGEIIWWRAGAEPASLLADGQVVMTSAYHRGFAPGAPVGVIPGAQVLRFNMLASPKGAPNPDAALDFLSYATGAERQAAQIAITGYGPSRRSAGALVAATGGATFLPTAPEALTGALSHDVGFWTENRAALNRRFGDWLAR